MANILPTTKQILNDNFNALNYSLLKKTVGFDKGMDYYVASGATDADVAINAAIAAVSAAGGGTVELGVGTFTVSEPIQIRSNVRLIGQGCGSSYWDYSTSPATWVSVPGATTIKAKDVYAPTFLNIADGYSLLVTFDNGTTEVKNVEIAGITWDANAQNWGDARIINDVGVSGARHRAIWPVQIRNWKFHDCEVMNPWNWCAYFKFCNTVDIYNNRFLSGWDTDSDTKYVDGNQDGLDVKGENIRIFGNYVDTYGISVTGDIYSGDDGIVVRSSLDSVGSSNVWVFDNFVRSGNRGLVSVVGTNSAENIYFIGNTIDVASASGILLERTSADAAAQNNIVIKDNIINQAGLADVAASGIQLSDDGALASGQGFNNVVMENNIINSVRKDASNSSGRGIHVRASGSVLSIKNNLIGGVGGDYLISINAAAIDRSTSEVTIEGNIGKQPTSVSGRGIGIGAVSRGVISNNNIMSIANTGRGITLLSLTGSVTSGIVVNGNRVHQWGSAIGEVNAATNYNLMTGNIVSSAVQGFIMAGANSVSSISGGSINIVA